jgi:hypothetical protein
MAFYLMVKRYNQSFQWPAFFDVSEVRALDLAVLPASLHAYGPDRSAACLAIQVIARAESMCFMVVMLLHLL